jgi:hypothetical protein
MVSAENPNPTSKLKKPKAEEKSASSSAPSGRKPVPQVPSNIPLTVLTPAAEVEETTDNEEKIKNTTINSQQGEQLKRDPAMAQHVPFLLECVRAINQAVGCLHFLTSLAAVPAPADDAGTYLHEKASIYTLSRYYAALHFLFEKVDMKKHFNDRAKDSWDSLDISNLITDAWQIKNILLHRSSEVGGKLFGEALDYFKQQVLPREMSILRKTLIDSGNKNMLLQAAITKLENGNGNEQLKTAIKDLEKDIGKLRGVDLENSVVAPSLKNTDWYLEMKRLAGSAEAFVNAPLLDDPVKYVAHVKNKCVPVIKAIADAKYLPEGWQNLNAKDFRRQPNVFVAILALRHVLAVTGECGKFFDDESNENGNYKKLQQACGEKKGKVPFYFIADCWRIRNNLSHKLPETPISSLYQIIETAKKIKSPKVKLSEFPSLSIREASAELEVEAPNEIGAPEADLSKSPLLPKEKEEKAAPAKKISLSAYARSFFPQASSSLSGEENGKNKSPANSGGGTPTAAKLGMY